MHFKRKRARLIDGSAIREIQARIEGVRVAQFAADVHGEFQLPAHRLDDARRSDLVAFGIFETDFDVGTLLKGRDFEIDPQPVPVGPGFGGQGCDMRLFGRGAGKVVFGKEKIHAGDYTRWG